MRRDLAVSVQFVSALVVEPSTGKLTRLTSPVGDLNRSIRMTSVATERRANSLRQFQIAPDADLYIRNDIAVLGIHRFDVETPVRYSNSVEKTPAFHATAQRFGPSSSVAASSPLCSVPALIRTMCL